MLNTIILEYILVHSLIFQVLSYPATLKYKSVACPVSQGLGEFCKSILSHHKASVDLECALLSDQKYLINCTIFARHIILGSTHLESVQDL